MEHRDATADRCLKQELAAVALRKRDELRAVLGDELLVGCHDVLAAPQRAGADVQRDAAAADGLHHELRLSLIHISRAGRMRTETRHSRRECLTAFPIEP